MLKEGKEDLFLDQNVRLTLLNRARALRNTRHLYPQVPTPREPRGSACVHALTSGSLEVTLPGLKGPVDSNGTQVPPSPALTCCSEPM